MAVGDGGPAALTALGPASQAGHLGRGAGLIDEDELLGSRAGRGLRTMAARRHQAALARRRARFFLKLIPRRSRKYHSPRRRTGRHARPLAQPVEGTPLARALPWTRGQARSRQAVPSYTTEQDESHSARWQAIRAPAPYGAQAKGADALARRLRDINRLYHRADEVIHPLGGKRGRRRRAKAKGADAPARRLRDIRRVHSWARR